MSSSHKMKTLTINGVQFTLVDETVGSLSDLNTTDKSSVVAAVNEVASNTGNGSGGNSVAIDATLTQEGQAADAKAVGDAINKLSSNSSPNVELDTTLTVEGKAADAKAVGDALKNLSVSGLTTAQINALDGMFKVAAYDDSKDVSGAYAAFRAAFGLSDTGGEEPDIPDEPDEPEIKTYTITAELVNVTSSNSAISVTEGNSYTATLTAADGYELDTVSVIMGGIDVTADVYADGVISIPAVTGNVEIMASAVIAESGDESDSICSITMFITD